MKCAPPGWHLPTRKEWENLLGFVEANASSDLDIALMTKTVKWENCLGGDDSIFNLGEDAGFWSSTERDKDCAYLRYIGYLPSGRGLSFRFDFHEELVHKSSSISVRLLRD